ncbi:putative RNA methyltransferase [Exophiala viscosa]|uniref:RNA methyltransferase n=1 Tax=Exophiala viscosa TaxID=2486360 RepID=A0AAN6IA28_9EURO|nr:putative RNA methyltransferase [Exophiala viscosa]
MPKEMKRKRENGQDKPRKKKSLDKAEDVPVDTSKPSAVFQPSGGRSFTLSIALAGSVIANAKSHDQKNFLAGQIARALAVFCVDEVVIFDDEDERTQKNRPAVAGNDYTAFSHPDHFLAHVLSYLETPPHLRKSLFPMHPNLRTAGTLPSLDMPHHLRANEWCEYREGVTQASRPNGDGTHIDVGLPDLVKVADDIPAGTRVTVRLTDDALAETVAPSAPREDKGYYWGFAVRQCNSLSNVLTECPFDGGYDVTIGTSERGAPLTQVMMEPRFLKPAELNFQHVLLVFGGVAGLEKATKSDNELQKMGITEKNVNELFDAWVNVLPGQGSRTIRTEEAVWLGLMGIRPFVERLGAQG